MNELGVKSYRQETEVRKYLEVDQHSLGFGIYNGIISQKRECRKSPALSLKYAILLVAQL